ncbi:MAG: hypothetical protein Q9167_006350 [Letrouitia subvulpina]
MIRRPHDCLDLANIIGHRPDAYRDEEFRFAPTHPEHVPYIPLPYIFRHFSCAMVLYTDPEEKTDISAWYKVRMEIEAIYATCQTAESGHGGRGVIGRYGRLTVGMVPSFDADALEEAMAQAADGVSAAWEGIWGGNEGLEEDLRTLNPTRTANLSAFSVAVL